MSKMTPVDQVDLIRALVRNIDVFSNNKEMHLEGDFYGIKLRTCALPINLLKNTEILQKTPKNDLKKEKGHGMFVPHPFWLPGEDSNLGHSG